MPLDGDCFPIFVREWWSKSGPLRERSSDRPSPNPHDRPPDHLFYRASLEGSERRYSSNCRVSAWADRDRPTDLVPTVAYNILKKIRAHGRASLGPALGSCMGSMCRTCRRVETCFFIFPINAAFIIEGRLFGYSYTPKRCLVSQAP